MDTKRAKLSLKWEIFALTLIPLAILTIVVTLYSVSSLKAGMQEEALAGLEDVCHSVDVAYKALSDGDYTLKDDELMKGSFNVTQNEEMIDNFVKDSDTEITLFYGDTRRATSLLDADTGEKLLGTQASATVTEQVVNKGEDFSSVNLEINGKNYYAYYIPMKNTDGSTVGMYFAGKPSTNVDNTITSKVMGILGISLVLLLLAAVVAMYIANKIGKAVNRAEDMLGKLSQGDLNISVDARLLRRKDELGTMCKSIQELVNQLKNIIGNMKQSADALSVSGENLDSLAEQTNKTVAEVSHAVEDISRGTTSQARDTEHAADNVDEVGQAIHKIVEKVETLHGTSATMEEAKSQAESIIIELGESSEQTIEAIKRIENQVKLTDESVLKIQDAISLISSIAEETNLLSLNASIEAARAGEAGKGFAVVASEIQKLAEESNSSADSIAEIIHNLARESKNTVSAMEQMQEIIQNQQEKLQETQVKFEGVSSGIQSSREEISIINEDSQTCDNARAVVTDAIQNLSTTSEENAAAAEQTLASMEALNSTMDLLTGKADELKTMARNLEEDMNFFKI
ncbi:MAG: cache domain-containing protein [Lachnospiraceae bacterium]|nr:cache domain-containing protein [Lachnospiraceae bacterium]